MIKAVIFDLEYTLENFYNAEKKAEKWLFNKIEELTGIDKRTFAKAFYKEKKKACRVRKLPKDYSRAVWTERALKKFKVRINHKVLMNLEKEFWQIVSEHIKLYKNTRQILNWLNKKGLKLAVISDSDGKREYKLMKLRKLGIKKYFKFILTTEMTGVNKPSIKNLKVVMKKLNVKPEECIVIGDHPETDLLTAKNIGMTTIWLRKGPFSKERQKYSYSYIDYESRDILNAYNKIKKICKEASKIN
jgi:putative hydrolase of the HAD superfamily